MSFSPYFENIEKNNAKLQWTVNGANANNCTFRNANNWYFYFGITSQVFDIRTIEYCVAQFLFYHNTQSHVKIN